MTPLSIIARRRYPSAAESIPAKVELMTPVSASHLRQRFGTIPSCTIQLRWSGEFGRLALGNMTFSLQFATEPLKEGSKQLGSALPREGQIRSPFDQAFISKMSDKENLNEELIGNLMESKAVTAPRSCLSRLSC